MKTIVDLINEAEVGDSWTTNEISLSDEALQLLQNVLKKYKTTINGLARQLYSEAAAEELYNAIENPKVKDHYNYSEGYDD